jgi:alkanesulfonate monooxygenase SsuD/methylene tetrahydromethanopterin reductase-like flavin-dependent oxidoreductase (luciferase family)
MEVATLARLHPGRFVAGIGHGMPAWMDQIGALPEKPVRALEETATAVRRLLRGERLDTDGEHVRLRDVRLEHPPEEVPPVLLGVRRPFGLRASGRSADGTILAEPAAPRYIRWARERIDEGRAAAGRTDSHRVVVFLKGRVDPDRVHARDWVSRLVANEGVAVQLASLGRDEELEALAALGEPSAIAPRVSDDLLDELTATGTPEQVLASLRAVVAAGVDSVALAPIGPDPAEQLRLLGEEILPAFRVPRSRGAPCTSTRSAGRGRAPR